MTCSKVDVTWSQSLTMWGLELMSGKLSLEHLTPGSWYCYCIVTSSILWYWIISIYVSMNVEVLFCNPNSLSCPVPAHTWLSWWWSDSPQHRIHQYFPMFLQQSLFKPFRRLIFCLTSLPSAISFSLTTIRSCLGPRGSDEDKWSLSHLQRILVSFLPISNINIRSWFSVKSIQNLTNMEVCS